MRDASAFCVITKPLDAEVLRYVRRGSTTGLVVIVVGNQSLFHHYTLCFGVYKFWCLASSSLDI